MNKFLTLITALFIFSLSSFAVTVETQWSEASEKSLLLTCNENEVCRQFCEGASCEVPEKVCKNCVSTSIAMTFAFKEMGRTIVSTEALDAYALVDLLQTKEFVSLTSRSIYNLVERFNSNSLKRKFRSLCADGTAYPHAFFNKTASGEIGAPQLVWCESGVYRLERLSELPSDSELF